MSYSEIQQQQELNNFSTNVYNINEQTNANFNVGVRIAQQNEAAHRRDTLESSQASDKGKYEGKGKKTGPELATKPTTVWGSILAKGQRSIIAIMAEVTMAQVKQSSNFWGALFTCSQNQLNEQVKMAPEIAKFQIQQADQQAAATMAQSKSAYKEGAWLIGALVTSTAIGGIGGGAAAYSADVKAAQEEAEKLGTGLAGTTAESSLPAETTAAQNMAANTTENNQIVDSEVNNGQNNAVNSALKKTSRTTRWFKRTMKMFAGGLQAAVAGGQVAGQGAQGMSQMTVTSKYQKIQAEHQAEAGKAGAAASEIQTLAQASGTMSNQQFQLASQTEQNGISGFLSTLTQAANGVAQAIGGLLSVR